MCFANLLLIVEKYFYFVKILSTWTGPLFCKCILPKAVCISSGGICSLLAGCFSPPAPAFYLPCVPLRLSWEKRVYKVSLLCNVSDSQSWKWFSKSGSVSTEWQKVVDHVGWWRAPGILISPVTFR